MKLQIVNCIGNENLVKILLKNGADVNAKDNMGWTVLHKVSRAIQGESSSRVYLLFGHIKTMTFNVNDFR